MVRGIGFLFLRYVADPEKLWEWYEPYVDDPQQFAPGGDKNTKMYVPVATSVCKEHPPARLHTVVLIVRLSIACIVNHQTLLI